jgi:uncharacterized FlaG/YvyC family protein
MDNINFKSAAIAPQPVPVKEQTDRRVVATELAAAETVTRSESTQQTENKQKPSAPAAEPSSRSVSTSITLDAETNSVILRKTDSDTGELLEQYPNQTQVSFRNYARELAEARTAFSTVA